MPTEALDPFVAASHSLVTRAAELLRAEVEDSELWPELNGPRGGKMFGVLVASNEAEKFGYLQSFAGRMGKRWTVPGYAPPVFEEREEDPRWIDGERELASLELAIGALEYTETLQPGAASERLIEHKARRTRVSRQALSLVQNVYRVRSWAGDERTVSDIFAPDRAPAGVGECAAPKLLAEAQRLGLRPVALGELWLGGVPPAGNRAHGQFYPACAQKCGRLLPFMLRGLAAS
mgnify:CR=1 FL=1